MAPCRTFGQAISQTNAGGEVYILDTAGYGPFSINKSVSIVASAGVTAGISVFSGDGIDINAGAADVVILRGLTINNQGGSGNGIVLNSGGTLHIESCVVNGFSGGSLSSGVEFLGSGKLEVKDSTLRGNSIGIVVSPALGTAIAAIDQVRLEGGGVGLGALDGSTVAVRNSLASDNSAQGFAALSMFGGAVELNIENCFAFKNNVGIGSGGSVAAVTVRVSNSTVTDNGTGLSVSGASASLLSRGNNTVQGNSLNKSGTIGSYNPD
jgi:hypothetical protein